ncbi:TIGR03619 family F420-dependent LLM class oxidoreductase [Streptomyces caniferus]|uniref:TIGR03619 family F420-dependent LLM class oxidoreductase n=1 Tax=Streptomyces caniferus TaxID=285557 RepID=UPI002E27ADE3|nr:TIGR03619 family F420-dependent LLM class oxidoreductase [Streptomyces caniferus]
MRIGFAAPVSGPWATPDTAVHVARSAEDLGYDSLWTYQRVLGAADDSWGEANRGVHDPLVTLSFLAAHTTRIRLGVAVLVMPLHTPAVLAKQLTTLDLLSGGRLDVGLGNGWAAEEYAAAGVTTTGLGRRADDFLACLRALWAEEPVVEHDGPFYRVPPSRFAPGPAQSPHPPLLLGGSAPAALRRAGRLCDGWIASSKATPDAIRDAIAVVRDSAEQAGRDPAALRFVCRAPVRLRPRPAPDQPLFTGTADKIRADLAGLADTGLTEIFVDPNFDPGIGSPDAPADEAASRVDLLLRELAPTTW